MIIKLKEDVYIETNRIVAITREKGLNWIFRLEGSVMFEVTSEELADLSRRLRKLNVEGFLV